MGIFNRSTEPKETRFTKAQWEKQINDFTAESVQELFSLVEETFALGQQFQAEANEDSEQWQMRYQSEMKRLKLIASDNVGVLVSLAEKDLKAHLVQKYYKLDRDSMIHQSQLKVAAELDERTSL